MFIKNSLECEWFRFATKPVVRTQNKKLSVNHILYHLFIRYRCRRNGHKCFRASQRTQCKNPQISTFNSQKVTRALVYVRFCATLQSTALRCFDLVREVYFLFYDYIDYVFMSMYAAGWSTEKLYECVYDVVLHSLCPLPRIALTNSHLFLLLLLWTLHIMIYSIYSTCVMPLHTRALLLLVHEHEHMHRGTHTFNDTLVCCVGVAWPPPSSLLLLPHNSYQIQ